MTDDSDVNQIKNYLLTPHALLFCEMYYYDNTFLIRKASKSSDEDQWQRLNQVFSNVNRGSNESSLVTYGFSFDNKRIMASDQARGNGKPNGRHNTTRSFPDC